MIAWGSAISELLYLKKKKCTAIIFSKYMPLKCLILQYALKVQ